MTNGKRNSSQMPGSICRLRKAQVTVRHSLRDTGVQGSELRLALQIGTIIIKRKLFPLPKYYLGVKNHPDILEQK